MVMVIDTAIDRASDRPAYKQIADRLRDEIDAGRVRPGDRLPSESELMAAAGVSRATARRGLGMLINEGRAESRPGDGVFAAAEPKRLLIRDPVGILKSGRAGGQRRSMKQDAEEQGFGYEVRIAALEDVRAPDAVADALHVPHGTIVFARRRVVRIKHPNSTAFEFAKLADSYFPLSLATDEVRGTVTGTRGVHGGIVSAGHRLTRYAESLVFRMPTPDETYKLKLVSGVPVIEQTRTAYTDDGPVECFVAVIAGDKHELEYRIPAE